LWECMSIGCGLLIVIQFHGHRTISCQSSTLRWCLGALVNSMHVLSDPRHDPDVCEM
jgi:hypothetical protein